MTNQITEFQQVLKDIGFYSYVKQHSGLGDAMPTEAQMQELTSIVIAKESGGNPNARVTGSGYTVSGVCQFTNGTYKECLNNLENDEMKQGALARINELTGKNYTSIGEVPDSVLTEDAIKNDNTLQGYAFSEYWAEKFAELNQNGIPVDANSVAIMHQYSGDGPKILKGDPATSVLELSAFKENAEEGVTAAVVDDRLRKNGLTRESTFGDIVAHTSEKTGKAAASVADIGRIAKESNALIFGYMREHDQGALADEIEKGFLSGKQSEMTAAADKLAKFIDDKLGLNNTEYTDNEKGDVRIFAQTLGLEETAKVIDPANKDKKLSELGIPADRIEKLRRVLSKSGIKDIPDAEDITAGYLVGQKGEVTKGGLAGIADAFKKGDWLAVLEGLGPILGALGSMTMESMLCMALIACVGMSMFSGGDKEQTPQEQALAAGAPAKDQVAYSGAVDKIFLQGAGEDAKLKDIGSRIVALNTIAEGLGPDKTKAIIAELQNGKSGLLLEAVNNFPEGPDKVALQKMFNADLKPEQMIALADGQAALASLKDQRTVNIMVDGKAVNIDMTVVARGSAKGADDNAAAAQSAELSELQALLPKIHAASLKGADALVVTPPAATPAAPPAQPQQYLGS